MSQLRFDSARRLHWPIRIVVEITLFDGVLYSAYIIHFILIMLFIGAARIAHVQKLLCFKRLYQRPTYMPDVNAHNTKLYLCPLRAH
jgi:hypothetical protein